MYPMNPSAIYATEEVFHDPRCVARMDRMLKAMGRDDVVKVDDAELSRLCLANGWHETRLKGAIRPYVEPPIVFNTMKWHTREEQEARYEKFPGLKLGDFGGVDPLPGTTTKQAASDHDTTPGNVDHAAVEPKIQ